MPDTAIIDCATGTVFLDGTASSLGFFSWSKEGQIIGSGTETLLVDDVGIYVLSVANQDGSCIAMDSILVTSDCAPAISIIPVERITCQNPTTIINAANSTGQALTYEWIAPDPSCIIQGQGTPNIEVSCGGSYTLILTNTSVLLSDTQTVVVEKDADIPIVVVGPSDTLSCVKTAVLLDGSGSSTGPNIIYRWTRVANNQLIAETLSTTTTAPGTYRLEVIDTLTQCEATATLRIMEFNLPITLSFGDTEIACGQDTFPLQVFPTPLSDFYTYEWTGPAIIEQADSATVLIGDPGNYQVSVVDNRSACEVIDSISITEDLMCGPCVTISEPDTITCDRPEVEILAEYCMPCLGCVLQWTTSDGAIIANGNTLQPTVDQAGTYRLTAQGLDGFQTIIEVQVVANNTPPSAQAGPDRLLTCDSTSVALGDLENPVSADLLYNWTSSDNLNFTPANSALITVNEIGTYILQVTDPSTGCFSLDSTSVGYDTIVPIANAGLDQVLSCTEPFVILDGSGSSDGADIIYTWTSSNPDNCIQGETAINPIANCAGTYYLEVKNRNTGCRAIDSLIITSTDEIPVLTPLADTAFTCISDTIRLLGNIPADGTFSFEWCALDTSGQALPTNCQSTLELAVDTVGIYQFSVTNDVTGCQASFFVEVGDQRAAPIVNAGNDLVLSCTDDSLQLNAAIGPDPALLDFQWTSVNNLPIINANSLRPIISAPDTLILLVTNQLTACTAQDTVIILQDLNAPSANAGPGFELTCLQTTQTLQGSGISTSGGSLTYQWTATAGGNIQANDDTPNPLVNQAGIYILNVTDTQNNCTTSDAVEIIDLQTPPQAAIVSLDNLQFSCTVDSLLLDATISSSANGNALDFSWDVVSGGNLVGDLAQSTIVADAIGTYRLIVTDRGTGCRDTTQFSISAAVGAPVIQIASPASFTCVDDIVTIDASNSEFGPDYSATWFDAQGDIISTNNLQLTVTSPGSYALQIDNNATGCSNSSTPVLVGIDTLPPTVIIAAPSLLDCAITEVRLDGTASSTGSDFQFNWTSADGLLLDAGNQAISTAGAPGTYQLEVTNIQNGCTELGSTTVEAITTPITGTQFEVGTPTCLNAAAGSIRITEVLGGTPSFTYMLNDGVEFTEGNFDQLTAGTYRLSIRDVNGCEWEEEVVVPEVEQISLDLGPDITISIGDSIELEAQTTSTNIAIYQWDPPFGDGSDSRPSQTVAPIISTSYGLTVTDSEGCVASDRLRVLVMKDRAYYLPTAFTPDGDGNNDQFMVFTGPEVINIPSFRIYDRWGHLVYERFDIPPNDPSLGWNGQHNGQLMNSAVFVYYVELEYNDGWVEAVKGDVTLLR